MNNILVTGSLGQLGSDVVKELLKEVILHYHQIALN